MHERNITLTKHRIPDQIILRIYSRYNKVKAASVNIDNNHVFLDNIKSNYTVQQHINFYDHMYMQENVYFLFNYNYKLLQCKIIRSLLLKVLIHQFNKM